MNEPLSSCEIAPTPSATDHAGSRVLHFREGFRWEGVAEESYKSPANHWCGVRRFCLIGERSEGTKFHLRYFEIEPGGFSSFEQHAHEHAVFVLRGRGEVQLGAQVHEVGFGDLIYVAPHGPHQLRNPSPTEVFGFLCVVDAERDHPEILASEEER